jgi:signal transduction histidine kinase
MAMTMRPLPGARTAALRTRGGRLLAWGRRHPALADVPLLSFLLWQSVASSTGSGDEAVAVPLALVALGPLLWRRRAPLPVFAAVLAATVAQVLLREGVTGGPALLVSFYTVASREPHRRVLAAFAAMEGGAVLLVARYRPAGVNLALLWVFLSGLVCAAGLLGYYVRGRRAHLAALVDRAQRLEREREQEARLAAAAERARIAREMHDIVAHNLAVMIALSDGAAYTAEQDPGQAVSIMGHVSDTGRAALTEMRRLLGVLRDPVAETTGAGAAPAPAPGLADLDHLLATVRAAGLPTALTVSGQPFPLPPSAQLTVYRVSQEALTNTLKHAAATSARVRLDYRAGRVALEITDDGRPGGSTPPDAPGHGIAGMRERAAVFGGEVTAGPRPGGGWRVHTVLRVTAEGA